MDKNCWTLIQDAITIMAIGLAGMAIGFCLGASEVEKRAVKAGVASYEPHPSGALELKWHVGAGK